MKVLQVIDTLNVGGAERVLVMLANLLHQEGGDICVMLLVCDGDLVSELNSDIPVFRLERTKRFDASKMKQYSKIMNDFDIVHTHLKHNYRYTQLVAKRHKIRKPRIIFHDHSHNLGVSMFSLKHIKDSLFKNILKPKYYIGVSQENCHWASTYLGVKKTDCYLLENVVDKQVFNKQVDKKEGLVMVSNITKVKHLEFAIRLAAELNETLTIYGRVNDPQYFDTLKQLVEKLDVVHKIRFISNSSNVQQELYRYKYAIHTSLKETGPLVLIEYLAQNVPFLANGTGQVFNALNNELPEFFIDYFDISSWKQKLKGLKDVSDYRMENAYQNHFSTKKYINKCLTIYQHILNS